MQQICCGLIIMRLGQYLLNNLFVRKFAII